MTTPTRCELCEDPLGGGHDLLGGMALCRRCAVGDLERVAAARGWKLWVEQHEEYDRQSPGGARQYVTLVGIDIVPAPALRLICERHRWWMKLFGLLRRRARSSDPLFETHVRVWTPDPAQAQGFMRRTGVESSLLDLAGGLVGSGVEIRGSSLKVRYRADEQHPEGEIVARAGVLARHVERFAVDDEPARPRAPSGPG